MCDRNFMLLRGVPHYRGHSAPSPSFPALTLIMLAHAMLAKSTELQHLHRKRRYQRGH
jgi:hypothetical protein